MNNFYIGINCAIECNFIFYFLSLKKKKKFKTSHNFSVHVISDPFPLFRYNYMKFCREVIVFKFLIIVDLL